MSKTDELTSHSLSPYYKPLVVSPTPSADHTPSTNASLTGPLHSFHLFNEATPTNPPLLLGGNEDTPITSNQSFMKGAVNSSTPPANSPAPPVNGPTPPVDTGTGSGVSLAVQLCPVGPKERCTPSQAQAMGQQVLSLMVSHDNDKQSLPCKLMYTYLYCHCIPGNVEWGTVGKFDYIKPIIVCLHYLLTMTKFKLKNLPSFLSKFFFTS